MAKAQASNRERSILRGFEGRCLGNFRMLREIACGGMATIYLARRVGFSGFGQAAAVKVIHPHLAKDRDFVDMFLDEARIVSCINHPNVCRVLDFGKAEGTYYLAMEYVMGETWSEVLNSLKQTPETKAMIPALATYVLTQACEGMHAAHEARDPDDRPLAIVHRDVSPQNLMVGYDGSVRVLDFGIASAAERLHTTRNGTIKGRFAYMAPEQMRGVGVDRRADVWSLGVVLWEALAQRRLFKRDTEAETVLAVTHDALPSVENPSCVVPDDLMRVVRCALERDRDARYATARELGVELSRLNGSVLPAATMADMSARMQRAFGERIAIKREILRDAARDSEAELPMSSSYPPPSESELQVFATVAHVANHQEDPSFSTVREVAHDEDDESFSRGAASEATDVPPTTAATGSPMLSLAVFAALTLGTYLALRPSSNSPSQAAPSKPTSVQETPRAAAKDVAPAQLTPVASASAPEAATASPAEGAVSIATPGGSATVFYGDTELGVTPGRFYMPVGSYLLRFVPVRDPSRSFERTVEFTPTPSKLRIPL
ncbi:MAG: protein kinase [Myxococcales bacterium]